MAGTAVTATDSALRRAVTDLSAEKARWALIGGLAVMARSVPRFTMDVDFAVAVAEEAEADSLVFRLRGRGYYPKPEAGVFEQDHNGRLSTIRLAHRKSDVLVDLLFASCGIEDEIVAAATREAVLPRLRVPVATRGHLIAMKALAGRPKDRTDLGYLIPAASAADLKEARDAVRLIQDRGYSREHDVTAVLDALLAEMGRSTSA
jgi:Nucleotidyl transferase AbiEii toxin, Type IV TA system